MTDPESITSITERSRALKADREAALASGDSQPLQQQYWIWREAALAEAEAN